MNKQYISFGFALLGLGILIGWLLFRSPEANEHVHDSALQENTVWTCSMHPQIKATEPGDCPICGMDLVPLADDVLNENALSVKMSPTAMQLAKISTARVTTSAPVKERRMNGRIITNETQTYTQTAHIPGRIERLRVDYTGQEVQRGQVVGYIYSPELINAQQELLIANRASDQPALLAAAQRKLQRWNISESQIQEVLRTEKIKEDFPILADRSGVVIEKKVNTGDYIEQGAPLYQISDLSSVWVVFDVYENDIAFVEEGDEIEFTVKSISGKTFSGEISFIDPTVNPQTRVATARVQVKNKNNNLKPGMFVNGQLITTVGEEKATLTIPKSAVLWTGERSLVYVQVTSPTGVNFLMREVVLGPEVGDSYIIREGLESGELIAISGTFAIDAAAQLAGKPSMMNPPVDQVLPLEVNAPQVDEDQTLGRAQNIEVDEPAREAVLRVIKSYIDIQESLAADNFAIAKEEAQELYDMINNVPMTLFSGEGHDVWMENSSAARKALAIMLKSKDINNFRSFFDDLSNPIIYLAKTFKPGKESLFVQYCPMANDDAGAFWLSSESAIENPYFGSMMHSCGETTEEIN